MMNRQNRKDRCTGRDLHIQASRILRQIPVGQHDTFTFSGRTGGKHNRTKLIRFRFIRISSLLLFKKLPERICLFILFRFLHGNQGFQLRTSIFYNCRHICADLIQHQDSHICPIDQLTHRTRNKSIRIPVDQQHRDLRLSDLTRRIAVIQTISRPLLIHKTGDLNHRKCRKMVHGM